MRRAAATLAISLLLPLGALAEDGAADSEDADSGQTRSLDSYDGSDQTRSLDSVDTGESEDLDQAETGVSEALDAVDTGRTDDLDQVDTGETVDLDDAEKEKPERVAAPAPPPQVGSAEQREEAKRIHDQASVAARRLESANAAYSQMMSRGHPAGDERAKIIQERDAAQKAWQEANARYTAMLQRLGHY